MTYPIVQATDLTSMGVTLTPPSYVQGVDDTNIGLLAQLIMQWQAKRARNKLKTDYWDGKHKLDHIGFSIPPALRQLEEVVGWPAKAVQAHAERCMFDGFVSKNDSDDPYGIQRTLVENRFDIELPMAITSTMVHSCAFIAVTPGDVEAGEPEVLVMPKSAQWASGLWNWRTRALDAAFAVNDVDDYGRPVEMTLYTTDRTIRLHNTSTGWRLVDEHSHGLNRVPVETLAYRPTLDRPFGSSVISRPVMSITDDAVRTVLRSETSAEFYSAPQYLLLGADPDSFKDDDGNPIPVWEFIIGRINLLSKDEDGDVPKLEQISQQSVQPHIEQLRELACRFAGETNVPVSSLGVVTDNPSSAEAMHAAEKDLVIDCAAATRVFGAALRRVGQDIVMMRSDGPNEMDDELATLTARWRNPALPSVIDAGDAMVKLIGAFPWLAETTVALEEVGFTDEQITRLLAEKRRNQNRNTLDALLTMNGGDNERAGTNQNTDSQGHRTAPYSTEQRGSARETGTRSIMDED